MPEETRRYALQPDGALRLSSKDAVAGDVAGGSVVYVYDPHAPTPCRGGPSFNFLNGGVERQSRGFPESLWRQAIEERDDVLVFSTPALEEPMVVVGRVRLTLTVTARDAGDGRPVRSLDLLGRLCRVDPGGNSYNLCEGLRRLDEDELAAQGGCFGHPLSVSVALGATACEFRPGETIRLHVASAAHPRWMRNLGAQWDGRLAGLKHSTMPPPGQGKVEVRIGFGASGVELPLVRLGNHASL